MQPFSFVHAADLHLDSPFEGLRATDPSVADHLRNATFEAFERIVALCIDKRVDFILIAGDVYDGADRSLRAQLKFRDELASLAKEGIQSFVVHGNHDPLSGWSAGLEWPEEVHLFGGDTIEDIPVQNNGETLCHIYGISYPVADVRRNLALEFQRSDDGPFAIGLLHCNVGSDTGHEPYAPCSLDDLVNAGMDYWALGHVHNRNILREDSPMVIYPGNPQGRNIRETGPRGCYLVEVNEEGHPKASFIECDAVRWAKETVDITALRDEDSLIGHLDECVTTVRQGTPHLSSILQISLIGSGPLHHTLQRPGVINDLLEHFQEDTTPPFARIERLVDDTRPNIDIEARSLDEDFVGNLLMLAKSIKSDPDRLEGLFEHLSPLYDSARGRRILKRPDIATLHRWLDEAAMRCLEHLTENET
jgi:DNA repair exonuclease SbcCD nuclease subunit